MEHYSFLPLYHRRTRRLAFSVISILRQTFSLKQVSILTGVSVQTICRLLDTINCLRLSHSSTGKYQCILVDPKKHRILGILPDRTQSHLADYRRNVPSKEQLKVKFFVCDMRLPYVELAKTFFPNARGYGITEFEKYAKTFQAWRKEILNAYKYGITNGVTERFNNKIKVLKRSSYGIRDFNRFRTSILHCTS